MKKDNKKDALIIEKVIQKSINQKYKPSFYNELKSFMGEVLTFLFVSLVILCLIILVTVTLITLIENTISLFVVLMIIIILRLTK